MSYVDKHSIKQQVLDINIANVDDQEEVAMAISKVYKESIEAILSDICENLIPDNEVVRIDTMTIDIGHLAFNRLESEFPKAVKKALKEKLFHQIRDKKVSPVPSKMAVRQKVKNTLLYYLNTGQLPWYYEGDLPKLQSDFSSKELVAMPQLLRILGHVEARKRAVRFFSEKQMSDFLFKYYPMSKKAVLDELPLFKGCLSKLGRPMPLANTSIAKTAKGLLDDLKTDGVVRMWVMEQLLEQLVYQSDASRVRLIQLLPTTYRKSVVALLKSVDWKRGDLFSREERQLMEILVAPHQSRSQTATRGRQVRKRMVTPKELPMENGIVINNAGLILVWPYLEAFFTGLGLMKEQLFQDEKAFTKAIHLLHFMVFGSEGGDETHWLLNKILCGVGPTDFISDRFGLTKGEKQECEHLLRALIANWPALKNTGPDSLRQTFLQRDGLLTPKENGWLIKVERKGFDVLLDRLTWPISVVKLPWNQYIINVEW